MINQNGFSENDVICTHKTLLITLSHKILAFNNTERKCIWNTVEKGENAGNQYFLLYQVVF